MKSKGTPLLPKNREFCKIFGFQSGRKLVSRLIWIHWSRFRSLLRDIPLLKKIENLKFRANAYLKKKIIRVYGFIGPIWVQNWIQRWKSLNTSQNYGREMTCQNWWNPKAPPSSKKSRILQNFWFSIRPKTCEQANLGTLITIPVSVAGFTASEENWKFKVPSKMHI